jgi:V8-like Glu-specific endopeptidase
MATARAAFRRRFVVVLAVLLLTRAAAGRAAAPEGQRAREAMAYIRVVGDVTLDYHDVRPPVVRKDVQIATGSGFVIAPSGLVLTNQHVVDVEPSAREDGPDLIVENKRLQVFVGGGSWEAHVVASDPERDLAALQMTAAELPYLPLGDSDAAEPGRSVQVLGFPFGQKAEVAKRADADVIPQVSVTAGSLSATREDDAGETRFLQTDAAVQPGNSGGPMLDEDGYVVGVVRMKLAADATSAGAGFAIPVNEVKDFLETNGLLERLPAVRLRAGVRHLLEWKRLAVDLPDGYSDRSPARVLADAGEVGEIGLRIDRWETPWPASGLEEALLGGEAVPEFVPAAARPGPRIARDRQPPTTLANGRPPSLIGSGEGSGRDGRRFRVEYAIVDLGREKVVARYLGPADALAFNLGLLRRSLRSLEAAALPLGMPRRAPGEVSLEPAAFSNGDGAVLAPRAWPSEPATEAACRALPSSDAGLLIRHPADYTVVLRALRWPGPDQGLRAGLARCDARPQRVGAASDGAYELRFDRLGVAVGARGTLLRQGGGSLLLEVEAPLAKLELVEDLYARWVREVSSSP